MRFAKFDMAHLTIAAIVVFCAILTLRGLHARELFSPAPLQGSARYPYLCRVIVTQYSLLQRKVLNQTFSSGVLVSPTTVITSGKVLASSYTRSDQQFTSVIVEIGAKYQQGGLKPPVKTSGTGEIRSAEAVLPVYVPGADTDLALVRIRPSYRQPIKLGGNNLSPGSKVVSLGWGITPKQGIAYPTTPKINTLSVTSVTNTKITCSGNVVCPGDEGGPLILLGADPASDTLMGIAVRKDGEACTTGGTASFTNTFVVPYIPQP